MGLGPQHVVEVSPAGSGKNENSIASNEVLANPFSLAAKTFLGLLGVVGSPTGQTKRRGAKRTSYRFGFKWLLRAFCLSLTMSLGGLIMTITGIGLVVVVLGGLWLVYRLVAGLLKPGEM